MLDGILDDILDDSPKRGEIRPNSPAIRPAQTRVITEFSPNSPNSPGSNAKTAIVRWLHSIGETDWAVIDDVLDYCAGNPEALAYYLKRAEEMLFEHMDDDRRHCRECLHLNSGGYCIRHRFRPVDDLPRRCEDFITDRINHDTF